MTRNKALRILGLEDGYTEEELKKNYKIYVRKYHPDNMDVDDDSKFIEVKEAYEYLTSNTDGDTSEGDNNRSYNEGSVCPRCGGVGFRREKVKTPRGYMARKVKCSYCDGTGIGK